jgi:hypothetical protein
MEAPIPYMLLDSSLNIQKFNHASKVLLDFSSLLNVPFTNFIEANSQDKFYLLKRSIEKDKNHVIEIDLSVQGQIKHVRLFINLQ